MKTFSVSVELYNLFECDFCALSFDTKAKRMQHTANHFEQKHCKNCNKQLIRFGDEWYMPHSLISCAENQCDVDWNSEDERDLEHFMKTVGDELTDDIVSNSSPDEDKNSLNGSIDDIENDRHEYFNESYENGEITASNRQLVKAENSELRKDSSVNNLNNPPIENLIEIPLEPAVECNLTTAMPVDQETNPQKKKKRKKKSYICDYCSKSLTTKEGLHAHLGTHTDQKRFYCDYCGHGFNQMGN